MRDRVLGRRGETRGGWGCSNILNSLWSLEILDTLFDRRQVVAVEDGPENNMLCSVPYTFIIFSMFQEENSIISTCFFGVVHLSVCVPSLELICRVTGISWRLRWGKTNAESSVAATLKMTQVQLYVWQTWRVLSTYREGGWFAEVRWKTRRVAWKSNTWLPSKRHSILNSFEGSRSDAGEYHVISHLTNIAE